MIRLFAPYLFLLLTVAAFSQRSTLSYTEIYGLSYPDWDGGRTELEFADINGDGQVDILTIGDHGNPDIGTSQQGIIVYLGDGQGNWNVQMHGDLGYGGIAAGDANNDGFMDVGYGMHHNYSGTDLGDQLLEVALGDGTGTNWTPWDDGLATAGEDWGMFGTDFGDVDNDGDLDIGSVSFGCCAGVHVYLNNMDGTWHHSFGFTGGNSDEIFEFGDINNDGFPDIAVGHSDGSVYFGDGTGDFTLMDANLPYDPGLRWGISLGDVDGDGGKDIAFVNPEGGLEVWRWSEGTESWTGMSGDLPATGDFELTQLDDMDGDGKTDLFAFGRGTGRLWLGDGAGNWQQDASISTPSAGYGQALRTGGDIDHNGKPDIVLVAEQGSWPSYSNKLRCFKETSSVFMLNIRGSYPRGGEFFWQNCIRNIEWLSAVPAGDSSWVDLEYSVTGNTGPWYDIASGIPNNGCYQWLIPPVNSLQCHIRFTVHTESGSENSFINSAPFTISDGTAGTGNTPPGEVAWKISPNPFTDVVTISVDKATGEKIRVLIRDVAGNEIHSSAMEAREFKITVDMTGAGQGVYIFSLLRDEVVVGHKKAVKIR